MKGFVVVPEQVLDGEPRDADGLDEGELGVVDGLALGVGVGGWPAVLHRGERVQRHPHRGDHHEGDRYHRDHLREGGQRGEKVTNAANLNRKATVSFHYVSLDNEYRR